MQIFSKLQLYPVLRILPMLVLGIMAGDILCSVVEPVVWLVCVAAVVLMSVLLRSRVFIQTLAVHLSVFLTGSLLVALEYDDCVRELPDGKVSYEVVVSSEPQVKGKTVRFDALTVNDPEPHKIKLTLMRDSRAEYLMPGDGLHVTSEWKKPANYPGSTFDYERFMLHHGYVAQNFAYSSDWQYKSVSLINLSYVERMRLRLLRYRSHLVGMYHDAGIGKDNLSVLAAMTLGDKTMISAELSDAYSQAGASHILALSGLHLGVIYMILTLLTFRNRHRVICQLLILVAVWIFVLLVGMPPSVLRSAIMLTVYSFIGVMNRQSFSLNTLAFAAFVLLLLNPFMLYDVGFQMSFMAVLMILLFYKSIYNILGPRILRYKAVSWVWQLVAVSVAAQIGAAPLVAYYFGYFSCYFLLTNFIIIPLATVILYLGVLFFIMSPFAILQYYVGQVMAFAAGLMNNGVIWVASLPGNSVVDIDLNIMQCAVIYVVFVAIRLLIGKLQSMSTKVKEYGYF